VGQDGILRRIGNPPGPDPEYYGPIANRPQDAILPHMKKMVMWQAE